jgi:hypothetical protein
MALGLLDMCFGHCWPAAGVLWTVVAAKTAVPRLGKAERERTFYFSLRSFSWQHGSMRKDGERGGESHCVMSFLERGVANALQGWEFFFNSSTKGSGALTPATLGAVDQGSNSSYVFG